MKYKFRVTGIDCPNCARHHTETISKIGGISEAKINFLTEKLTIESELSEAELMSVLTPVIKRLGLKLEELA